MLFLLLGVLRCRGTKRRLVLPGEPQRSEARSPKRAPIRCRLRPARNPEVVAKAKRRTYTASDTQQRILQEAEVAATTRGGLGALLRREGLYSSLLTRNWRRERAHGILEALTPQKRGPMSKRNPMEEEVQKLCRQNARSTEDLRKAHIIIDVQKKVAALLGDPIPKTGLGGEILMAAVAELANDVGTSAACQALCMPARILLPGWS